MDSPEVQQLEAALTACCGRTTRVWLSADDGVHIALDPTSDRGRVELLATEAGTSWQVSDRGAIGTLYGLDLDFVASKLSAFDTAIVRRGDELVSQAGDRSLADAICEFLDMIEFVPVLAGLFANEPLAA